MDEQTFHNMKENIERYFETITPTQLREDLEKAGYSYYKKIDVPIIDQGLSIPLYEAGRPSLKSVMVYYGVIEVADTYNYMLAA